MKEIGIVDGYIVDLCDNVINMLDRGYQLADGTYEITRVYNGRCFALKPHLDRLFDSLRQLKIPAVYTYEELADFHEQLITESGMREGEIYLQISRGIAPRACHFPGLIVPLLTMSVQKIPEHNHDLAHKGVRMITVPDERWMRCDIRTTNLLANVLAQQTAKEAGCFEALLIRDDFVTEGASSSFFIIKDDVLWTHPLNNLISGGITRRIIIERLAEKLDLHVIEKKFNLDFMAKAEEAFICGTSIEIMPVTHINRRPVNDGKVGTITQKLQTEYNNLICEECI